MKLEEYLHELNKVKILEPEEEALLWQQYRQKEDMAARRRLIEAYQPLVFKLAMPYRSMECIMDIIQEGTVGLIEAAETYQPEKAVAFSFYAAYRIRGRILNFLKQEGRADVAILDADQEDGCSAQEQLHDPNALSVPEIAELHEISNVVKNAMERLPENERMVLNQVVMGSCDVKSVAAMMNVSTSHIYRLQRNGSRRIRGMLSGFMHRWK